MEIIGTHEDFDHVLSLSNEIGWVTITRKEQLSNLLCVVPDGYISFALKDKPMVELSAYHPDGLILPVYLNMYVRDGINRFKVIQNAGGPLLHSVAWSVKIQSGQKLVGLMMIWPCRNYGHPTTSELIDQSKFRKELKGLVSAWKKASEPVTIEGVTYRIMRSSPILDNISGWHAPRRDGGKPLDLYI